MGSGSVWRPRDLIFILVAAAIQQACVSDSVTMDGSERVVQVPIDRRDGLLIIEAALTDDNRALRFMIDTGSPTLLSDKHTRNGESNRENGNSQVQQFSDADGTTVVPSSTVIERLWIGGLSLENVNAFSINSRIFDRPCPPIAGLLGNRVSARDVGFLERVTIDVNLDEGIATIGEFHRDLVRGGVVVPSRMDILLPDGQFRRTGSIWIPVEIAGISLPAMVDTGARGLSEMSLSVFRSLGRDVSNPGVREYRGRKSFSVAESTRTEDSWVALIDDVRIGDLEFDRVPFLITSGAGDTDGVHLAQEFISRFNLTIDMPRGRLIFRPRNDAEVSQDPPLQMTWDSTENPPKIVGLLKGGAAERAGIRIDDKILSSNGADLRKGRDQGRCIARIEPNASTAEPLSLLIGRNGTQFSVTLPRRERLSDVLK